MKGKIVLYCEGSEVKSYSSLWEAYTGFKEIRRVDKEYRNGFKASDYNWEFEYKKNNILYSRPIKFYIRKGKMYYKFI